MLTRFSMQKALGFFVLSLLLCSHVFAQNKTFSQRLEWKSQERAYEYKIELRTPYGKINTYTSKKNFIYVSVPAGTYEWRVTAFDFLGREATKTEWKKFTIKKAVEPKAQVLSDTIAVDTTQTQNLQIPLETQDIEPSAKIELVDQDGNVVAKGKQQNGVAVFQGVPYGDYKVRVTNPGGKFCETATVKIAPPVEVAQVEKTPPIETAQEEISPKAQQDGELLFAELMRRFQEQPQNEPEPQPVEEPTLAEEPAHEPEPVPEPTPRQERPIKEIYILAGVDYLLSFGTPNAFDGKKNIIGGDIKVEWLPFQIKKFKLGFNLETQVFPAVLENSYLKETMLFIPIEANFSAYYPIKEFFYVGAQAGLGAIWFLQKQEFSAMMDDYKRDDVNSTYFNFMFDIGAIGRFIIKKHFVIDVTTQFELWHIDNKIAPNLTFGLLGGVRF